MPGDREMFYDGEADAAENLKLVRIVREVRQMRFRNPRAHISVEGIMSQQVTMLPAETAEKERWTTEAYSWSKREKLIWLGLPEQAIVVYKAYRLLPITGRAAMLIAHDSTPGHPLPTRSPPPFQPYNPASLPTVTIDPQAMQSAGSDNIVRAVEAEIEVEVWDDKGNRRKVAPSASVKLKVGPRGFEEVGAELIFLKATLRDLKGPRKSFWGIISKVRVTVKGQASMKLDKISGEKALKGLSAELEASLKADVTVAKNWKLPVELVLKADADGAVYGGIVVTFSF